MFIVVYYKSWNSNNINGGTVHTRLEECLIGGIVCEAGEGFHMKLGRGLGGVSDEAGEGFGEGFQMRLGWGHCENVVEVGEGFHMKLGRGLGRGFRCGWGGVIVKM